MPLCCHHLALHVNNSFSRCPVPRQSGGQKRRVSLAAALVHSPPLLILDEPTVGVDPLLRQSIWKHLVAMTKTERISVIITTHYIEEARLANVVGLMRNGRILAEDSPDELMHANNLTNLEDVFLKLCVTDSSRKAAQLATGMALPSGGGGARESSPRRRSGRSSQGKLRRHEQSDRLNNHGTSVAVIQSTGSPHRLGRSSSHKPSVLTLDSGRATVRIHTGTNKIEVNNPAEGAYVNEAIEVFSSEEDEEEARQVDEQDDDELVVGANQDLTQQKIRHHLGLPASSKLVAVHNDHQSLVSSVTSGHVDDDEDDSIEGYLALQHMHWAARRANIMNLLRLNGGRQSSGGGGGPYLGLDGRGGKSGGGPLRTKASRSINNDSGLVQWWKTLMAVTWKNYVRLRRNPPVLVFQFMLPAIQVILFCLCIGGEPFDVPVAIVNEEAVPKSSLQFLNGLNKKIIRQIKYDNLTSAIEAVKRGKVWGAIHIPDKYSENLQSRLIMGEEVTNETISNGTIRVYPDLTSRYSFDSFIF